jgi:hypothetical protein
MASPRSPLFESPSCSCVSVTVGFSGHADYGISGVYQAPCNPDAWVWKHGQLVRVGELETVKIRKYGRRFRRKDVAAVVELTRPLVPIDPMVA